jgi:hypothetical protein
LLTIATLISNISGILKNNVNKRKALGKAYVKAMPFSERIKSKMIV